MRVRVLYYWLPVFFFWLRNFLWAFSSDTENVPKDGEGEVEGEEGTEDEAELELTDEEESIRANLAEGEALPNETLDKILPAWWNEEPFRWGPKTNR